MKKLTYPTMARRMGWAGTVKVEFVVLEDGCVKDISVLGSSGFELLDKNAVETIKKASPFPKPPIMAQIIMPVSYRLE